MNNFSLKVDSNGTGNLIFDSKDDKVNKFSKSVRVELENLLDQLYSRNDIKILIITSGKKDIFTAGIDLEEFLSFTPEKFENIVIDGHRILSKLASLPFPTVAVIDGVCFGGGAEFALACTYRIVTDNPKILIGLPEVTFGSFPGWGGSQRLPRLVGLQNGLQMLLSGKPIKAQKAYKIHFADDLVNKESHQEFVSKILTPEGKQEVIKNRRRKDFKNWFFERTMFGRAILFALIKRNLSKETQVHQPAAMAILKTIQKSYTLPLQEGLKKEVELFINSTDNFKYMPNLIQVYFIAEKLKKDFTSSVPPRKVNNVAVLESPTLSLLFRNSFNVSQSEDQADFILESSSDDLELKLQLFAKLEQIAPKEAIIATNTSSITINEIANELKNPERFIGLHFLKSIVEVIPGVKTSPEVIATVILICKKLGKIPILVGDCPGFLVNRIFIRGAIEVLWLLQEGVNKKRLEKIMLDFGMPLLKVENDLAFLKLYEKAYGIRMKVPPMIKKSKAAISDQEILNRILCSMINEGALCLEEKIVTRPDYLDFAVIEGVDFPKFRGGIMKYADDFGIDLVVEKLKSYLDTQGERFTPSELLLEMSRNKKKFYDN